MKMNELVGAETIEFKLNGETISAFAGETIIQAAGFYYGGKFTDNSGALIQYNYDGENSTGMILWCCITWISPRTAPMIPTVGE